MTVTLDGALVAEGAIRGTEVIALATGPKPQGGVLASAPGERVATRNGPS